MKQKEMLTVKVGLMVTFGGKRGLKLRRGVYGASGIDGKVLFLSLSDGYKGVHLTKTQLHICHNGFLFCSLTIKCLEQF